MIRAAIAIAGSSVVLAAGSVLGASPGSAQTASPGSLAGVVTAGPTTPVCIAGQPCTRPAAGVVLVFSRGGTAVARVTVRADGSYRVRLAAGLYVVRASSGRLEPVSVRVRAGTTKRADFSIDTGIR